MKKRSKSNVLSRFDLLTCSDPLCILCLTLPSDGATSRDKPPRSESIPKSVVDESDVVTRFQEATQSMMGRISGMGRITGGLANKLGGGILKF